MLLFLVQLFGLTLFSIGSVQAQEENDITKLFRNYIQEVDALNQTKNIENLVKLLDRDFELNKTEVTLNGNTRNITIDRANHLRTLQQIFLTEAIQVNISIEQIYKATSGKKTAVISASIKADVKYEDNEAQKVTILINAVGANKNGTWKFIQMDNIEVIDERNLGKCPCRYTQTKQGFETEVVYPSGFAYSKKQDAFTFRLEDGVKTITVNDQLYQWKKNGELLNVTDGKNTALGTTTDNKKAVSFILGDLYKSNCTEFIERN